MPATVDSHIVERHEDGTWTETIVVNGRPRTKQESLVDLAVVGSLTLIAIAPLGFVFGLDWWERRSARKEEAKKLKSV